MNILGNGSAVQRFTIFRRINENQAFPIDVLVQKGGGDFVASKKPDRRKNHDFDERYFVVKHTHTKKKHSRNEIKPICIKRVDSNLKVI